MRLSMDEAPRPQNLARPHRVYLARTQKPNKPTAYKQITAQESSPRSQGNRKVGQVG